MASMALGVDIVEVLLDMMEFLELVLVGSTVPVMDIVEVLLDTVAEFLAVALVVSMVLVGIVGTIEEHIPTKLLAIDMLKILVGVPDIACVAFSVECETQLTVIPYL